MIPASEAHIKTLIVQKSTEGNLGERLAKEYKVLSRIERQIEAGKYDIVIAVEVEDCEPLALHLRKWGYYVQWGGDRSSPTRSMTIGWHPKDTNRDNGPP